MSIFRKHNGERLIGRFKLITGSMEASRKLAVRLRLHLLDKTPGYAATSAAVDGVIHEYQAVPGCRENALSLALNMQQIRIEAEADKVEGSLESSSAEVKAGDLKLSNGWVTNPELIVAHLAAGAKLKMRIAFEKGTGYRPASSAPNGFIPLDADFSPVKRVAVIPSEDNLDIIVATDGSVTPEAALAESLQALGEPLTFEFIDIDQPQIQQPSVQFDPKFYGDPFGGYRPPSSLATARESYDSFLHQGLPELLDRLFPLVSHAFGSSEETGKRASRAQRRIDLVGHKLVMPEVTPEHCLDNGFTYEARLIVKTRLRRTDRDGVYSSDHPAAIEEQEIDMGSIPLMTMDGSFIINGARRACIMLTDDTFRVKRVNDLLMEELNNLVDRMKPVMEDRLSASDWLHSEILKILPLSATINDLFKASDWCQYQDETNPLASLTHKRRVVHEEIRTMRTDPIPARLIQTDHWGRLGYLETPEGPNVGLVHTLAPYTRIDDNGEMLTPYRPVKNGVVSEEVVYLSSSEDAAYCIADSSVVGPDGKLLDGDVIVRAGDDVKRVPSNEVQMVGLSPIQSLSMSSAMLPFLGHDDPNRALMASNMLRQAVALVKPEHPFIKTGVEAAAAEDSGALITARRAGRVLEAASERIVVQVGVDRDVYPLANYRRSNQATSITQTPVVRVGQEVMQGQVLADSSGMLNGELALGRNVFVAYMPFKGYNFEDAICISDELVREDAFTSVFIEKYGVNTGDSEVWLAPIGTRVNHGDVLVQESSGKKRPLLLAQPYGLTTVVSSRIGNGYAEIVLAEKRNINVGDKFAGRHGNKGVIAKILPKSVMPYLEDGTSVQMIINPLGVISRMNLGQILETHFGLLAAATGAEFVIPPFMTPPLDLLQRKLMEAGLPEGGMMTLYDGATGRPFDHSVTVGYLYMLKLNHLVSDKLHAVSTGVPSIMTNQPRYGGQRLGSLEMWALEAYGAGCTLQESLTIKSDDSEGRERAALALLAGEDVEPSGEGQSLRLLTDALMSAGIAVEEER